MRMSPKPLALGRPLHLSRDIWCKLLATQSSSARPTASMCAQFVSRSKKRASRTNSSRSISLRQEDRHPNTGWDTLSERSPPSNTPGFACTRRGRLHAMSTRPSPGPAATERTAQSGPDEADHRHPRKLRLSDARVGHLYRACRPTGERHSGRRTKDRRRLAKGRDLLVRFGGFWKTRRGSPEPRSPWPTSMPHRSSRYSGWLPRAPRRPSWNGGSASACARAFCEPRCRRAMARTGSEPSEPIQRTGVPFGQLHLRARHDCCIRFCRGHPLQLPHCPGS